MNRRGVRPRPAIEAASIAASAPAGDDNVGLILRYTFRSFTRILQLVTGPFGLTAAEFRILRTLATDSGVSQVRLAALAAMDRPYAALIVKQLRAKELIESLKDPNDGRRTVIRLSRTGRPILNKIDAQLSKVNALAVSGVNDADFATFVEVMGKIRANLEACEARFGF